MEYLRALPLFEEILTLYPDHKPSKKYLKEIAYDISANDRTLEISIHKYLLKAEREFQRNNLLKAQKYYTKVLGVDTENVEAQKGLENIQNTLKKIKLQKNRQKNADKIISLGREGMKLYNDRNFAFAKEKFDQILDIDPENAWTLKYLGRVETKINKVSSAQINVVFNQAMSYYNNKDYETAAKFFNAVYTAAPSRNDAKTYYEFSIKALNENNPTKKSRRK
jgi:tetratricopeptide (TPR) repeat protein